jgi:hypothetical protein
MFRLLGLGGLNATCDMDVCLLSMRCFVRTVSGFNEGPIPRPEESYRLFVCVCVCVRERVIECDQMQQKPSTPTIGREKGSEYCFVKFVMIYALYEYVHL